MKLVVRLAVSKAAMMVVWKAAMKVCKMAVLKAVSMAVMLGSKHTKRIQQMKRSSPDNSSRLKVLLQRYSLNKYQQGNRSKMMIQCLLSMSQVGMHTQLQRQHLEKNNLSRTKSNLILELK